MALVEGQTELPKSFQEMDHERLPSFLQEYKFLLKETIFFLSRNLLNMMLEIRLRFS